MEKSYDSRFKSKEKTVDLVWRTWGKNIFNALDTVRELICIVRDVKQWGENNTTLPK